LWEREALQEALGQSGFVPLHLWGSYGGDPFDPAHSARLILLARAVNP
jgi:hypothetical protein